MADIATVLKQEIARIARKELKGQTEGIKKASAQYRRDIAELKREVSKLQKQVSLLEGKAFKELPSPPAGTSEKKVRFTTKWLRSERKRLKLSASDYARLVGVNAGTIYNWEGEKTSPRNDQLKVLAGMRGISKKEALARLEHLGREQPEKTEKS